MLLSFADKRARILDAEGLALGAQIATSKKRARDLINGSFHRSDCANDLITLFVRFWGDNIVFVLRRFANSEDMTEIPAWLFDDEKKQANRKISENLGHVS